MSKLPRGWMATNLAEIAEPRGEKVLPSTLGDAPFVGMDHIEAHTSRLLATQPVSELKSAVSVFKTGDILYGRLRPYLNKVHEAQFDGAASAEFIVIPPSPAIEQQYLAHHMRSPEFVVLANQRSTGDRPRVSFESVADFPINLPPLPEQRRIVAKIDSLSAKSRPARDHLNHIPRLVEKYKQAILAAAFRGKLTREFQSLGNEIAGAHLRIRLRDLHRESYQSNSKRRYDPPASLPTGEELFELPPSWVWAASEEVVEPGAEIVYGIVQPGPKLPSGVPYVRGTDIEDGRIKTDQLLFTSEAIARKYERASLKGGDVLLGIIRATKVAIVPHELLGANITQGTARFRPSEVIMTKYLARWLESSEAQGWLHSKYRGIDMPGLNLRDVRRLPVPLAPIQEQRCLVDRIERAFAWIDRLASESTRARALIDHLDQAVLAYAFLGKLLPQDPGDEPASALLERMRAERAATGAATGKGRGRLKTAAALVGPRKVWKPARRIK